MLAKNGAGMFEYHAELKPTDFDEVIGAQEWLHEGP
jgi:hypothetical protein